MCRNLVCQLFSLFLICLKVCCRMQLNIVAILGLIHFFTFKYNNLARSCKFSWYHIAYFIYTQIHKMHANNHQYLWMNETWCKVGLRPCYRKITRIFWIVLAALQNRLLSCCHWHADAATTTVSNKSLTALTDDCSELSLSPTLVFSFCFPCTRTFMWKWWMNSY